MTTMTRRADFLRAASARRQGTAGFLLQARRRDPAEPVEPSGAMRVGYTCSKKLGNAVARNRAKRRLRAIAREVIPAEGRGGWDYVLVGRPEATATRDFAEMRADLARALARVHAGPEPRSPDPGAQPRRRGKR
ncbi:ribonuclease P protein component [Paracoccus chinensis]|uniref:Ribonuclease P protein component n=1 Tax=Paracoccus chinensis TaxID=525640 RepID=A0A1G9DFK6_9RHOB|nr:ribonuclease P protein component [Paracoccus chinensis]SDK62620.1 ribonuclease P protein component [Paracoccus chinensis]